MNSNCALIADDEVAQINRQTSSEAGIKLKELSTSDDVSVGALQLSIRGRLDGCRK